MLRLVSIVKDYPLKDLETVHALKGINLNFRKNEFVAILGPSGCGKTTLLNITGGLDRYTSGDLVIEGRSTKNYTDRDWDTYRNHSIGFVFQSYNLVPHLSILGNVELALTIGGYKKNVRHKMAMAALDKVGLKGLYNKKPNQLSGGQMQRVAIARALVNDPEILLADEPTGALDSETSIQIMDLLKEVAKDRLVIMVTHNPELANKYANRIVQLKDGEVISDSKPFSSEDEEKSNYSNKEADKPKAKAKMSFVTSFGLSLKNLVSKFKRTALVCVAGSIGIIGVSAVLAVSTGVKSYIRSMQDDMLSGNPISISKSSLDMTGLLSAFSKTSQAHAVAESYKDGQVNIDYMIEYLAAQKDNLMSYTLNNSINQDYIDFVDEMPREYYSALKKDYGINFKLNIYTDVNMTNETGSKEGENRTVSLQALETMYIDIVKQTPFNDYASVISLLTDTFFSCPDDEEYILSQYDCVAGDFAREENEIMLVISNDQKTTDLFLGQLGYYTQDQFVSLVNKYAYANEGQDNPYENSDIGPSYFTYEQLMNKEFNYVPYSTNYTFSKNESNNPELNYTLSMGNVYADIPLIYRGEATATKPLPSETKKIKVTGILKPKKNVSYGCLDKGFIISNKMEQMILNDAYDTNSVAKATLEECFEKYQTLDDTRKSKYALITPYCYGDTFNALTSDGYTYYYNHYDEETSQIVVDKTTRKSSDTSAISIANISSTIGGSGTFGDVITKMYGNTYSIENQFDVAIRKVAGKKLAQGVSIYPHSFDEKYLVTNYLDAWNIEENIVLRAGQADEKILTPADRDEINYVDSLELIISLINNMVEIVTIALVCFTSLSLVVSTVMIGIITYVSVLERVKEIGVIRSLGGRKIDISNLFNAETFIEGLTSGVFGIFVTYLLCGLINIIINNFAPLGALVYLPWHFAIIIICISILLTLISGLIPARLAAQKDPVIALRSE